MKRVLVKLLTVTLLLGVLPLSPTLAAGDKAAKMDITVNGAGIARNLTAIASSLLTENDAAVTVLNSGSSSFSFYLRTDIGWDVDTIIKSPTITLAPGEAAEVHCGRLPGTNQVMLMGTVNTTGTLTICNLSQADAEALVGSANVIDSPSVTPKVYEAVPAVMPKVEGDYLIMTDRNHRCSGPSQDITAILNEYGPGSYYYGGWVRVVNAEERGVEINLGLQLTAETASWPQTSAVTTTGTAWIYIAGTINVTWTGTLTNAITFPQTLYSDMPSGGSADDYAYKGDLEFDGFTLNYMNTSNGAAFTENLLKNPGFDAERTGLVANWTRNQGGTLTTSASTGVDFTGAVENSDGSITYPKGYVPMTDKNIKYVGRWVEQGDGSYRGSFEGYCELTFTGTELHLLAPASGTAYLVLDGGTPVQAALTGTYKVSDSLSAGEHTLRIYPQAQQGLPAIGGFMINENASTIPAEERTIIEFVGDSILEGYVGAAGNPTNSYLYSYGYKTGELLGWDYNTVAFGGITMTPGYGNPDTVGMVNRYFLEREYLATDTSSTTIPAWDTSKFVPDYMVINLGTNDSSVPSASFQSAYLSFIEKVKAAYIPILQFLR